MAKSSQGYRKVSRRSLKASVKTKFKPEKFLKAFKEGDKVIIKPDPSSQKGMPFHKFTGKLAVVKGKRGSAYLLDVRIGNASKAVIAKPEHLKKA